MGALNVLITAACGEDEDTLFPPQGGLDGSSGSFDAPVVSIADAGADAVMANPDAVSPDVAPPTGPIAGDTFASPTGVDTANTCANESSPCLSVTKAVAQAAAGRTVWLANGVFPPEIVKVTAGLTVRGRTPQTAVFRGQLQLIGGRVQDLTLEQNNSMAGGIAITAGDVALEGVEWRGLFTGAPGLAISGTAAVTLRPGTLTNYVSGPTMNAQQPIAVVRDTAQLTMLGGVWDGHGLGSGAQTLVATTEGAAFIIRDKSKLRAEAVTFKVNTRGILLMGEATAELVKCTISSRGMESRGYGVMLFNNTGTAGLTATDTTISGFTWLGSGGIFFVDDGSASTATASLTNVTLTNNTDGISVTGASFATVRATLLTLSNNYFSGIHCDGTCDLDLAGGSVTGNGSYSAATYFGYYGGLALTTPKPHKIKLRNVAVTGNRNTILDGNTNNVFNSGVSLVGTAASVFDLGTAASPGGNTFSGNDTGNQTANLHINVAAEVTVNAVGNTFTANIQGANAAGKFLLGTAPCSVADCVVGSGAGANLRVTTGKVRLAE